MRLLGELMHEPCWLWGQAIMVERDATDQALSESENEVPVWGVRK